MTTLSVHRTNSVDNNLIWCAFYASLVYGLTCRTSSEQNLEALGSKTRPRACSLHTSQWTYRSASCAYKFIHTLANLIEACVYVFICYATEWAYDSACFAYTFTTRTRSQSCLRPVCVMQLSELMTLHLVPICSRMCSQSLLRPVCTCLCVYAHVCMFVLIISLEMACWSLSWYALAL